MANPETGGGSEDDGDHTPKQPQNPNQPGQGNPGQGNPGQGSPGTQKPGQGNPGR